MRRTSPALALAALTLLMSACDGGSGSGAGPGAVSEGEAQALDEAAKMLDEKRLPEGALPDVDAPLEDQSPQETPGQ
ncbi:MAG: hypothetical protein SXU28_02680 [Pseudomonadota bacterium]|nr:hypothetical protein [Pseudomonadota bacterium]